MTEQAGQHTGAVASRRFVLFNYGFRPFFLFAGIYGMLAPVLWLLAYSGGDVLPGVFPAVVWHGHEMLFGVVTAAAAGFLLTAVPNWTGTQPVSGARLVVLAVLWLGGRAALLASNWIPSSLVAAIDISMVPALIFMVGVPIVKRGNRRNYVFLALLFLLVVANAMVHMEITGLTEDTAEKGLRLAIYVFILLLTAISGRVVPNFTAGALRVRGEEGLVQSSQVLEKLAIIAIVLVAIGDLADLGSIFKGVISLFASGVLLLRMRRWQFFKTLDKPIVWVLHVGHIWLALGFFAMAVAELGGIIPTITAIHAFTMGAFGTMTMAIMSRATLGHTGRPLVVHNAITLAYVLISIAAVIRVFAAMIPSLEYQTLVIVAGIMWISAYALFTIIYLPILIRE